MVFPFVLVFGGTSAVFADQPASLSPSGSPLTIDDLGFSNVMNERVFSSAQRGFNSTYRISSTTAVPRNGSLLTGNAHLSSRASSLSSPLTVSSMMEIEPAQTGSGYRPRSSGLVLDSRYAGLSGYEDRTESDSFNVRRFSTAISSDSGTLTVGNDWSNFQDFLGQPGFGAQSSGMASNMPLGYASVNGPVNGLAGGITAEQVRWQSGGDLSNISIAVENNLASTLNADSSSDFDNQPGYSSSPNLVVSWQGSNLNGSQYRVSAMGRHLELDQSGAQVDADDGIGWGLNLAGGWRFGDLVAALSVTLGNSIDSFILGRVGNSDTAAAAKTQGLVESFNINPSLAYQLDDNSNLHFSLNRYQRSAGNAVHGVDTLDTIHLGYSWNPWPSTRFGVEFVGKDVNGGDKMEDSNAVNFAASKRF